MNPIEFNEKKYNSIMWVYVRGGGSDSDYKPSFEEGGKFSVVQRTSQDNPVTL